MKTGARYLLDRAARLLVTCGLLVSTMGWPITPIARASSVSLNSPTRQSEPKATETPTLELTATATDTLTLEPTVTTSATATPESKLETPEPTATPSPTNTPPPTDTPTTYPPDNNSSWQLYLPFVIHTSDSKQEVQPTPMPTPRSTDASEQPGSGVELLALCPPTRTAMMVNVPFLFLLARMMQAQSPLPALTVSPSMKSILANAITALTLPVVFALQT